MTGKEIHARFRGVNYVRNGRSIATDGGLDCWGFVREVWACLGMAVPPAFIIEEEALRSAVFLEQRGNADWVRLVRPEPWALCLLVHPSHPDHCGVVSDDYLTLLHCNLNGVHATPLDSSILRTYGKEYYRYNPMPR